ncbi:MAG: hypothetical protein DRQ48_01935 [Gammaproteobacteria bacterium]|nr:MAG: hypothetical protein DRQ48_01935 [Gammaproteobacteria bacterium]
MSIYYEVKAVCKEDGETEVLYGSFNRHEAIDELDAERDWWKEDYKQIKIVARNTSDEPDPEIYPELY